VESWIELAEIKRGAAVKEDRTALDEAVRCFEEAIWHEDNPDAAKELHGRFLVFLESIPESGPAWKSLPPNIREEISIRKRILRFIKKPSSEGKARARWIKETSNHLRSANLPKKARWIFWREICRLTGDKIGAETARENIRTELNRSGLHERDSFSFVSRHMLGRFGSQAAGRKSDLDMLLRHVLSAMETIGESDYRSVVRSMLAKCHLEFSDADKCRSELRTAVKEAEEAVNDYNRSVRYEVSSHSLDKAHKARAVVLSNVAGAMGRLRDDSARAAFSEAVRAVGSLRGSALSENEEALQRLLENLEFAKSPDLHQYVLDGFWEIFNNMPPDRRHICLGECAPVLSRLGENDRGARAALSLLQSGDRYNSFYTLRHAMIALVTFLGERQLDDKTALSLVKTFTDRLSDANDHAISYIRGLLSLAPKVTSSSLERHIPGPDPGRKNETYNLIIHSCIAEALAFIGEHEKALAKLENIAATLRQLTHHQRTAVLRHVITALRSTGRPEDSLKLLLGLQNMLAEDENPAVTAPVLLEVIETTAMLSGSIGETRKMQEVLTRVQAAGLQSMQFSEIHKTLMSCLINTRKWTRKENDLEVVYQLITRARASTDAYFEGASHESPPEAFYHGSILIGIAHALSHFGRDSEAVTVFLQALNMIPLAFIYHDELSASVVESVFLMESHYQVQVLLNLLEIFPKMIRSGLGSPNLKDSVLPRIVDNALMGEPLFKVKLREHKGFIMQDIRKRLRTDNI